MDVAFTPAQTAFREEVRAFMRSHLPPALARKVWHGEKVSKAEHVAWQQVLGRKGWLAPSWVAGWGGPGWGPVERFIFDEESQVACAPRANIPAIDLLGPVIIEFGTQAQKQRFLPPILASEHWWCQGFSEPGAGSDLAALSTRAVLDKGSDGDHYVVNGTKLWTSYAHDADWIFCLVRTSIEARKQAGISFLLLPMDDPGITVTPIVTLGGMHAVNQVIIDNVRVPADHLIGREGQAWEITKFLLGHERLVGAGLGYSAKYLAQLQLMLQDRPHAHRLHERLALLEMEFTALKTTAYRVLADEAAGHAPGPVVSVLKIRGSELRQAFAALWADAAGPLAAADPLSVAGALPGMPGDEAHASQQYLDNRKLSIYGGSAEIQRNIIAQRILNV